MKSLLFRPRFETENEGPPGSVKPCKKDPKRAKTRGHPASAVTPLENVSLLLLKDLICPLNCATTSLVILETFSTL